jgi:hypothetical protein
MTRTSSDAVVRTPRRAGLTAVRDPDSDTASDPVDDPVSRPDDEHDHRHHDVNQQQEHIQ